MGEHQPPPIAMQGRARLADFIRDNHARLLAEWEHLARRLPGAGSLSWPRLLEHLPELLEQLARAVETPHACEPEALVELPAVYALERLDEGFDLKGVAEEYALLRACILQRYGEHAAAADPGALAAALQEVARFNRVLDAAVASAVSRYAQARERMLVALERIAQAGAGAEDLDTSLPGLLRIMLETHEAVDSVTLMLRTGDTLHTRASVGLEEEVSTGFSLRVGEGFSGKVAAERHPLELRCAASDPLVRSPFIQARGLRALYGVPLLHGEELLGVAHMGSRTAYEFSHEDKLLFRTLLSRATSLIIQARLTASQRVARAEAEERKELLRLIIEQSGDAIIMVDARGVVRIFNAEASRQHGTRLVEVGPAGWVGTYGLRTLDGRPMPLEEAPLYRALQGEPATDTRWKVQRPDGTLRILNGTASPLRRPDGSLAGALLIARDETERLQREAEQARALAQIDALVAAAPAGLALLDTQLRYVRINDALAAANGLPVEAHLGRTLEGICPAFCQAEPRLRRVLETGEAVRGHEFSAAPANDPGVAHHWVSDYYPVRARDGAILGIGMVVMDITERRRQEQELRRTAEFRERFLGIVSHDLRGPLQSILLSTNVLVRSECVQEHHLKSVRRITASAERMERMIADLLDFTRGRLGGGIPLHARPVDLQHLCRQVLEELGEVYPERELRLEALGDFHGEWDADRLAQVFGNLGRNALDYSPEGGAVRFLLRDEGRTLRVEVHNEGPPIPQELLSRIFEPFRRASGEQRRKGGLGLGLFIVQQIIHAHGGSIEVRSSRAEGTTFSVRLPRRTGGAEAALSG